MFSRVGAMIGEKTMGDFNRIPTSGWWKDPGLIEARSELLQFKWERGYKLSEGYSYTKRYLCVTPVDDSCSTEAVICLISTLKFFVQANIINDHKDPVSISLRNNL